MWKSRFQGLLESFGGAKKIRCSKSPCAKCVPNDASFIIDFWIRLVASLPGLSQVLAIADVSFCFFAETTVYGFIFAQRNMTSNDPRNHKSTHFQTGFKNPPPPCRLAVTPGSRLCHSRLMLSEEGCNEKRNGHVWGEDQNFRRKS